MASCLLFQAPDVVRVRKEQMRNYTIRDLLPCSIYRVAVACSSKVGIQSDWSSDVSGKTQARGNRLHSHTERIRKCSSSGLKSSALFLCKVPPSLQTCVTEWRSQRTHLEDLSGFISYGRWPTEIIPTQALRETQLATYLVINWWHAVIKSYCMQLLYFVWLCTLCPNVVL